MARRRLRRRDDDGVEGARRLSAFNFALSRRTPHLSISLAASMDPSGSAEAAPASSPTVRGLNDVLERAVGDDQAVPDSPLDADLSDPDARLAAELRRVASAQPRARADPDTPAFGGASLPHQRFTSPATSPLLPLGAQAPVATPAGDRVTPGAIPAGPPSASARPRRWNSGPTSPETATVADYVAAIEERQARPAQDRVSLSLSAMKRRRQ